MDRINGAGHVGHLFVAEDAALNRPPTEITPGWMNGVQEEMCLFIESQGIVLNPADNTQLGQAIRKAIQAGQRSVIINNAVFAPAVAGTGKAVYWDAGNNRFDLALADGSAKQNMVGFADVANGNVYAFGDAVLFAGLTPGRYYLDAATAGAINAVAPARRVAVGIARSATEVFIDIDEAPVVAATAGSAVVGSGTGLIETPWDHDSLTINGSFEVNQRAATTAADDTYCLDRFYILTETGSVAVAQITDPEAGAPWGIRLTQPDAGAKRMGLATIIESKDCRKLRGAVATLAARVKLSTGGTLRYAILEHTGTADAVTSDVVGSWASAVFTAGNFFIAGLNVLQCGTITPGAATYGDLAGYGAVGAGMNNLIAFVWTEAAAAPGVTLDINRLRLVPGSVALTQRYRSNELSLCQGFFEKLDASAGAVFYGTGYQYTSSICMGVWQFEVPKRVNPTMSSSAAPSFFFQNNGSTASATAILGLGPSDKNRSVIQLALASTVGYSGGVGLGTGAGNFLAASSEV